MNLAPVLSVSKAHVLINKISVFSRWQVLQFIQKLPEPECFSVSVQFIILQIFIANNVAASYFVNYLLTNQSFDVGDSLRNCFEQI